MKTTEGFNPTVSFETKYRKEILNASNYADGLFVNTKHLRSFPEGTKLKVYVGNKFENNDALNIYHYDQKHHQLNLVQERLDVKDGYVEFDIEKGSDYFITMSDIGKNCDTITSKKTEIPILWILIPIGFILLVLGILAIAKNKKKKKETIEVLEEEEKVEETNVL